MPRTNQVNAPARPGPYTDVSITLRNPPSVVRPVVPAFAVPASLKPVTVYDQAGTNHKPNNSGAPAMPHAPNRMAWPQRDTYREGGATGQAEFASATEPLRAGPCAFEP